MQVAILMALAVVAGAIIAVQNVLNAALSKYVGSLGAVLVVALLGLVIVAIAVVLFPKNASFRGMPGAERWYLYLGGLLGIVIVALPVFLVPRIGATATITGIVLGQLAMALVADQVGLFGSAQIGASPARIIGVALLAAGAFLVARN